MQEIAVKYQIFACGLVLAALAGPAFAEATRPGGICFDAAGQKVSREAHPCQCYDAQGKLISSDQTSDECLALPPQQEATNFIGVLGPAALVGGGVLAALAGGGSSPSTTGTTSTTSTTSP